MTVDCHVNILGGDGLARILTFEAVPRVGECVGFSMDGKRDTEEGLTIGGYTVRQVIHIAANEKKGPIILIDVEKEPVDLD